MKTRLSLVALLVLGGALGLLGQNREHSPTKELMRKKLDHAQSVLEGITQEIFELVAGNAARLGALSQEAAWRASDTPEYANYTVNFWRSVEGLKKAAQERNLDAVTLAYTKMTFSCVDCHKYLRNRKVASVSKREESGDFLAYATALTAFSD